MEVSLLMSWPIPPQVVLQPLMDHLLNRLYSETLSKTQDT